MIRPVKCTNKGFGVLISDFITDVGDAHLGMGEKIFTLSKPDLCKKFGKRNAANRFYSFHISFPERRGLSGICHGQYEGRYP